MNKAQEYMNCVTGLLQTIMDKEAQNIEAAAQALKNTMVQDGMIYSFGTGHSVILCSESYRRAGGLANCCPILDQRVMPFPKAGRPLNEGIIEREEGVTAEIFKRYPLKKGDSMFVFCYGGKNATSIDAGLLCKELGVTTICISSVQHALAVGSTHSSGLLAHQACDISIDNHGPVGDAAIPFDGFTFGPVSTIVGASIVQSVCCRAVELAMQEGYTPDVLLSMNVPGGDEHNQPLFEKYDKRIIRY